MNKEKADYAAKLLNLYDVVCYTFKDSANNDILLASGYWHELPGLLNYEVIRKDITENRDTDTIYCYSDFAGVCYYLISHDNTYVILGPVSFRKTDRSPNMDLYSLLISESEKSILFYNYISGIPMLDDKYTFERFISFTSGELLETPITNTISRSFERYSDNTASLIHTGPTDTLKEIKSIENRYYNENQLLAAVSSGNSEKALQSLKEIQNNNILLRISGNLRDYKNAAVSLNALLRKAIENCGVNPYIIDRISLGITEKLEGITSIDEIEPFLVYTVYLYSDTAAKQHAGHYSAGISRITAYIRSHLSDELSLSFLAKTFSINPSHLSAQFKKEVGIPLTDYVNSARLEYAKQLLRTTNLSITEIAENCGINDANYFSRMFRKKSGVTPLGYRKLQELPTEKM